MDVCVFRQHHHGAVSYLAYDLLGRQPPCPVHCDTGQERAERELDQSDPSRERRQQRNMRDQARSGWFNRTQRQFPLPAKTVPVRCEQEHVCAYELPDGS